MAKILNKNQLQSIDLNQVSRIKNNLKKKKKKNVDSIFFTISVAKIFNCN
jgi:hypothetical protein